MLQIAIVILFLVACCIVYGVMEKRAGERVEKERNLKQEAFYERIRGIVEKNNRIKELAAKKPLETISLARNEYSEHQQRYSSYVSLLNIPYRDMCDKNGCFLCYGQIDSSHIETSQNVYSYYEWYNMERITDPVKQCALLYALWDYYEKEFYERHSKDVYETIEKSVNVEYRCETHTERLSDDEKRLCSRTKEVVYGFADYLWHEVACVEVYDDIALSNVRGVLSIGKRKTSTQNEDDFLYKS